MCWSVSIGSCASKNQLYLPLWAAAVCVPLVVSGSCAGSFQGVPVLLTQVVLWLCWKNWNSSDSRGGFLEVAKWAQPGWGSAIVPLGCMKTLGKPIRIAFLFFLFRMLSSSQLHFVWEDNDFSADFRSLVPSLLSVLRVSWSALRDSVCLWVLWTLAHCVFCLRLY